VSVTVRRPVFPTGGTGRNVWMVSSDRYFVYFFLWWRSGSFFCFGLLLIMLVRVGEYF